jgi:processing peptidase subunit beta
MLANRITKNTKMLKNLQRRKSAMLQTTGSQTPSLHQGVQFSKERLVDFGELPTGQIPLQLTRSPRHNLTTFKNNSRVCTEVYNTQSANVSVFVNAGSRWETLETSGSARLLLNLFLRGTKNKSRKQLEEALQNLGGDISVTLEREIIGLTLKVDNKDIKAAVDLLCEMVLDVNLNQEQIDNEKLNVLNLATETTRDQYNYSMEALFYTSFREHMIGQPVNGNRDSITSLVKNDLEEHQKRTFVGKNFNVVVSGNVNHEEVVKVSEKWLTRLPESTSSRVEINEEKPYLTSTMMSQRDDEMANLNLAVGFLAPGMNNPEYVSMLVYQKILDNYNAHENGQHLNTPNRQYNTLHKLLAELPGVTLQRTKYFGFSDVGLFTCWTHGHEIFSRQMLFTSQYVLGVLSNHLNQAEIFRARAKLFNELLRQTPSTNLNLQIARNLLYNNRRITRTEMAYRFSHCAEGNHLKSFAKKWFFDKDMGVLAYGYVAHLAGVDHYHTRLQNSTRGDPICQI